MKDFLICGLVSRLQVRRPAMILRDLYNIGAAVAFDICTTQSPVAMWMQPHGLGVDRTESVIAGKIGQIAAMQAYVMAFRPRRIDAAKLTLKYSTNEWRAPQPRLLPRSIIGMNLQGRLIYLISY